MSDSDHLAPTPDYFDTEYRDYERQNPPRKLRHYLDVIDRHTVRPRTLLDIGCGRGAFLGQAALRHPDWELHGTDISPEGLEATAALVPTANLRTSTADLRTHADDSFDVITALDVVEHIPSLDIVASAVGSMLRPGGLFVFVVPVYDGVLGSIVHLLDKDPTHVHEASRRFWLDWSGGSFEVLEWHGIFRYLLGRYYVHIPTRRLRINASAILVVCRSLR